MWTPEREVKDLLGSVSLWTVADLRKVILEKPIKFSNSLVRILSGRLSGSDSLEDLNMSRFLNECARNLSLNRTISEDNESLLVWLIFKCADRWGTKPKERGDDFLTFLYTALENGAKIRPVPRSVTPTLKRQTFSSCFPDLLLIPPLVAI